ncbi:MAG: hypothetical protein KF832_17040 [Caldilineaceae bacterium]|nr:hypothetical protein [Caldilineaceae bacterium]
MQTTFYLGIRHHGPGSAYSVVQALGEIEPDLILIEGPPEAEDVLALARDPQMEPPVALLVYAEDNVADASFFPFALFSPEWQAIQFGARQGISVRLMDLPQTHHLALLRQAKAQLDSTHADSQPADWPPYLQARTGMPDPLGVLAQAAGFTDGERWWERLVEQRQEGLAVFTGIAEAMTALRSTLDAEGSLQSPLAAQGALPYREALREAWMRQSLRRAHADGFRRIAVICGAWHVPALQAEADPQADAALLSRLPRCPVVATWTPWSYGRLATASGYRAGVSAPGWYHFLWESHARPGDRSTFITTGWLAHMAQRLRAEGHPVATANVIDAVRLSEALTALRDKPLPDLDELNEAALTTLCFGDPSLLQLIYQDLAVSERLGRVPPTTPLTPLQADLARLQRSLRLKPEAEERIVELDLRKENGLERSKLLRRLLLLAIPWGELVSGRAGKGTFKEVWRLQWQPEFAVRLIEASRWGNSVVTAAVGRVQHQLQSQTHLAQLAVVIDQALLADLPPVVDLAVQRLQQAAALANDVTALMDALPPLARVLRYGHVRATDTGLLTPILQGFVTRIVIGLPGACYSLDDAAAQAMLARLEACHEALSLVQSADKLAEWWVVIQKLADQAGLHGLIAGKCCRLLFNAGQIDSTEAATRFSYALSLANRPADAAAWLAGLLRGSGLLLIHDARIWQVVDSWLVSLTEESFIQVLPLVRRTFAAFAVGERRMMSDKVKQGAPHTPSRLDQPVSTFDAAAGAAALPLVLHLLGIKA